MSQLMSLLRMRAAATGRAQRAGRLRHHHISAQPLMMMLLNRTGAQASPLAVMLGTDQARPHLLVAPTSGTATPMLTALARELAHYIEPRQQRSETLPATSTQEAALRYTDAPQILVPNPQTVDYLRKLGRKLRFRPADAQTPAADSVPRLGQWLTFFADRAEIPGAASLLAMTDLLGAHWVTGQSPLEDQDLAALLAWIDPPRHVASGLQAALEAETAATHRSAGPVTDAAFDNQQLAPLLKAHARASEHGKADILRELDGLLADHLQPTWDRMWQAFGLLHGLPEADSVKRRWSHERGQFTQQSNHLAQDGPPRPARDNAVVAAIGLARREHATAVFAAERAADDPFARAELRTTGDAFAGSVTAVDIERITRGPTGRPRWRPRFTMSTQDPVRLEPGQALAWHGHRKARYRILEVTPRDDDTLVELEVFEGMGTVARPNHAACPEASACLVLTIAPDYYRMPEFPSRDQTPWTHGGPPSDRPDAVEEEP